MQTPLSAKASGPLSSARTPRVAVIVPAYGVAHLVGEALESVLAQTMPDWECVVVDDGAPDDVAGAVAPYLHDSRIRFLQTRNHGLAGARNNAIAASTAPLISLLDGDDLFRPAYLERMVEVLESDPDARLATCNGHIFGDVLREHHDMPRTQGTHGSLADVLERSFSVYIGSTFRRADFDRIGGFDESMRQCEDLDFWIRLMQLGGYARYIDEVLGDYRVRADSLSANVHKMLAGNIRAYEKASEALGDSPEGAIARRVLAEKREALAFEQTIDRIIDGDTRRGLRELRAARSQVSGVAWRTSLLLWRIAPPLAGPVLRARRMAHALNRGASKATLFETLLAMLKQKAG